MSDDTAWPEQENERSLVDQLALFYESAARDTRLSLWNFRLSFVVTVVGCVVAVIHQHDVFFVACVAAWAVLLFRGLYYLRRAERAEEAAEWLLAEAVEEAAEWLRAEAVEGRWGKAAADRYRRGE